eukprot:TRINITY_DN3560_c0_g1_i6.p2 TRINITY_DN3560_c0_g1~~TRINITY_DN3560_c0_g1_i6.p2  ORF type:complete len:345 (-),score=63.08 TRINITY_DN3560_c0_g1_i6:212-1246(-)
MNLNKPLPFQINHPNMPVIMGHLGDLLIHVVIDIIIKYQNKKNNLYTYNLLAIICNTSPFLKNVNQASAVRLHELIIIFSTEEFLLQEEHNYLILAKVLSIIENLIVFQYDDNLVTVVEVVNHRKDFVKLRRLELLARPGADNNSLSPSELLRNEETKHDCTTIQNDLSMQQNIDENDQNRADADHANERQALTDRDAEANNNNNNGNNNNNNHANSDNANTNQPAQPAENLKMRRLQQIKLNLPLDNLFIVLSAFAKSKKTLSDKKDPDPSAEIMKFAEEKSFLGCFKKGNEIAVEAIRDVEVVNSILDFVIWTQIVMKSNNVPYFDIKSIKRIPFAWQSNIQ